MALKQVKKQTRQKENSEESSMRFLETVIIRPRITEKASFKAGEHVYVFDVSKDANKKTITSAIRKIYSVIPLKVHIAMTPSKAKMVGGRRGIKSGGKKAYIHLEKGDKIDII